DSVRPRKYYEITEAGKQELAQEQAQWSQVNSVLDAIWNVKPSNS
ncbi:PadR family transcriptional regulator, partial [Fulvivirga lutimaris]